MGRLSTGKNNNAIVAGILIVFATSGAVFPFFWSRQGPKVIVIRLEWVLVWGPSSLWGKLQHCHVEGADCAIMELRTDFGSPLVLSPCLLYGNQFSFPSSSSPRNLLLSNSWPGSLLGSTQALAASHTALQRCSVTQHCECAQVTIMNLLGRADRSGEAIAKSSGNKGTLHQLRLQRCWA
jgi:hypothetical protein